MISEKSISKDDYSLQGDSIAFSTESGVDVTIRLLNSGKSAQARIHYRKGDMDTVTAEDWTRLPGTFTPL